jgi:hypothetical protein
VKKLKFTCPHCEAKLRVPTHLAGVSAPCPKCGEMITAPSDITAAVFEPAGVRRNSPAAAAPARARVEAPAPMTSMPAPAPVAASTAVMAPPSMPSAEPDVAERPVAVPRPAPVVRSVPSPAPAPLPVPVPAETRVDLAPSVPASDRAGLVPPPTVAAPAFFTPPPPIRPLAPPDPEEDEERSAPPVSLEDESEVVVEEQYFEEGPPPPLATAPITQPIQISALQRDLPLSEDSARGGQSLPRLDVALGGETKAPPARSTAEPAAPGRTRVFLPQPGSGVQPASPEDFLTPPVPRVTVPVPVPEVPLAEETFGTGTAPSPETFQQLAEAEMPVSVPTYTTIPIPSELDAIPLDELEGEPEFESGMEPEEEEEFEDPAPPRLTPALPDDPAFEIPEWSPEPLDEFEPIPAEPDLSASWPETETSSVTLHPPVSRRQTRPWEESCEEVPENPLHEGSFANLFSQQAPLSESAMPPESPAGPHSDLPDESYRTSEKDLDTLFDSGGRGGRGEKGVGRTMIVMIASVVVVAIIAGVGVILVINSFLGGFSPAEAYKEPEGEVAPAAPNASVAKPRIPTSSATASAPDLSITDAPAIIDPPALPREGTGADAPALSFDEKVQQMVNGRGASVIGSPSLDIVEKPVTDFTGNPAAAPATTLPPAAAATAAPAVPSPALETPLAAGLPPAIETAPESAVAAVAGALGAGGAVLRASPANDPAAVKDLNYNPPESFAAPGPGDKSTLGKTHDLIDAFLRAPDVATRLKYAYQGESLRAAVEDYHKKWPYERFDRYSLQLYQMELDPAIGGPYWVFIVSTSDEAEGFPFIVRTENGLLKADWQIFAEFSDRQFLGFRDGKVPSPGTFRLILERFTDYYGSDRDAFTDLGDYLVYQVYPPYGETEFSEFVFVKKDSELGRKLDKLVGIGDEPLAVVITLDQQAFAHGVKHFVITNLVTEGWFK